jgi:hypothetical protein
VAQITHGKLDHQRGACRSDPNAREGAPEVPDTAGQVAVSGAQVIKVVGPSLHIEVDRSSWDDAELTSLQGLP